MATHFERFLLDFQHLSRCIAGEQPPEHPWSFSHGGDDRNGNPISLKHKSASDISKHLAEKYELPPSNQEVNDILLHLFDLTVSLDGELPTVQELSIILRKLSELDRRESARDKELELRDEYAPQIRDFRREIADLETGKQAAAQSLAELKEFTTDLMVDVLSGAMFTSQTRLNRCADLSFSDEQINRIETSSKYALQSTDRFPQYPNSFNDFSHQSEIFGHIRRTTGSLEWCSFEVLSDMTSNLQIHQQSA